MKQWFRWRPRAEIPDVLEDCKKCGRQRNWWLIAFFYDSILELVAKNRVMNIKQLLAFEG